jgi:hypothetical protein
MPALFAYLFSLVVFIGGGYAGLIWLTEPPAATNRAPMSATALAALRKHPHQGRKTLRSTPDYRDDTEITGARSDSPDDVPPVKNIREPEPSVGLTTEEHKAASSEHDADNQNQHISQNAAPDTPPRQATLAETGKGGPADDHSRAEKNYTGTALESQRSEPGTARPAQKKGAEHENPAHRVAPQAKFLAQKELRENADLGDRHDGGRKKVQQASRPPLVMMTLRTLEFPDGHREERLLPLQRAWREGD